ncbi:membrane protein [Lacrimispora amygdalina]|uniref:Membrane protein n=1 Tax=Lacrimispora amygdalina TaxID=253257 RepID=A0ABQ5M1Y9_9FIRM
MKQYMIVLLLGHVLGDFYTQTEETAKKKESRFLWVMIHCLSYLGTMVLTNSLMSPANVIYLSLTAAICHFFIDTGKYFYLMTLTNQKKKTPEKERNIFFVDQILHIISLLVISFIPASRHFQTWKWQIVTGFFDTAGISFEVTAAWILALLLVHKPMNLMIQKMLLIYKPMDRTGEMKRNRNAGRLIGTMERIIMLILISRGQHSAAGLVLTAKSIARYDRISKDQDFAEYYLLGTLMSTAGAILCSRFLIT